MRNHISWAMILVGLGMITFSLADASERDAGRTIYKPKTQTPASNTPSELAPRDLDLKSSLALERLLNRK